MERKYLWRHLQIYACNPPHGVNINITSHHNTAKFLVACTPNGAVSFVSPVFVGSISDIELTRESGFLTTLQDKPGISIMADRGFTIKDMLKDIGIELNIPPFMEGRSQLPAKEVQEGRRIASVRIHVESDWPNEEFCYPSRDISYQYVSNHKSSCVCVCISYQLHASTGSSSGKSQR